MTRDEIAALISHWIKEDKGIADPKLDIVLADRILALLPPREPTPDLIAAVEAYGQAEVEAAAEWQDPDAGRRSQRLASEERDAAKAALLAAIASATPPREPTPAMVEAMWKAVYRRSIAGQMDKQEAIEFARAAWAAGYAAGVQP